MVQCDILQSMEEEPRFTSRRLAKIKEGVIVTLGSMLLIAFLGIVGETASENPKPHPVNISPTTTEPTPMENDVMPQQAPSPHQGTATPTY